jgi:hypothetical protein
VRAALAITVVLAAPATARAGGELSLGLTTGGHVFSHDLELGVADAPGQGTPASGVLVGARVGVRFLTRVAVEGELVLIPTTERMSGQSIDVLGYRAQAAVDLVQSGSFRGFLLAGAGFMDLLAFDVPGMDDDTDLALHWGAGAAAALAPSIELRFDARHLVLPSVSDSGAASDFELTTGLAYLFSP